MSVASAANHMRAACAWSSACKLGSPIMTRTPLPPTAPASDSSRTLARPSGCDHCAAAPQSSIPALRENVSGSSLASQAALPRTAALLLLATVFSSSKKVLHASCAYGKTRPRSAHFLFALQSGCATSLAFQVGSCQKLAASDARRQDGVQISLTMNDAEFRTNYEYFDGAAYIEARFASGKVNYLAISKSETY